MPDTAPATPLLRSLDDVLTLVDTAQRPDLRRRLEQARSRASSPTVRVLIVGETGQGKSQLVNALVAAPVCPVDDDVATAVPTIIGYGENPTAHLVRSAAGGHPPGISAPLGAGRPAGAGRSAHTGSEAAGAFSDGEQLERTEIAIDRLAEHVTARSDPASRRGLLSAEVSIPRAILADGLTIVDSPGVGGLESAHALATMTALPTADAVILVSDASQEYTEPEMQFLRQAMRVCPNVACVLSKTDLYSSWRTILDIDRRHLDAIDPGIPLFAVSSQLRLEAARDSDPTLNATSGFPELVGYLRNGVVGQSERLHRRSLAHDLRSVTDQLAMSMRSELSSLVDPAARPAVVAELENAKGRADDLRKRSAQWQVTLSDGIADLMSDIDHDLRDRMRVIQREADTAIDAGDPGPMWESLVDWLEDRIVNAISDTFVWSDERARWLAERVAASFGEEQVRLPAVRVGSADGVLDAVELVPELDPGRVSAMQKLLTGMRGSYGGVLMIGLVTGLVGMSLINPFSIAAGLLIGGKAYRDDKEARMKKRQVDAKNLVRKQIDEILFQVGKELKDRLRQVQRTTRDHFGEIAGELHRSLGDSLLAAQKAATMYKSERERRVVELKAQLARIDAVAASVDQAGASRPRRSVPAPRPAEPKLSAMSA